MVSGSDCAPTANQAVLATPQQVGAGAIFDDILDAVAVAGLDDIAVVDFKGNHLHATLLTDRAVAAKLGDVRADGKIARTGVGPREVGLRGRRYQPACTGLSRESYAATCSA
jgi:hypothetical protein